MSKPIRWDDEPQERRKKTSSAASVRKKRAAGAGKAAGRKPAAGKRRPASRKAPRRRKKNPLITLLLWVLAIAIAFVISQYLRRNVFEIVKVSGDAMYETLIEGDWALVTKGDYEDTAPRRGEIVAVRSGNGMILRRVIGLPGETIEVREGETYINGERYLESYMFRTYDNFEGRTVSPNRYYVMGDNRMSTYDSRDDSLGLIPAEDLVGKVRYVLWPFNHFTTF